MKKHLSLLFLSILAIPGFLSATAVRLTEWERPNGTRIVIIGDCHVRTYQEALQPEDFIEHLKSQKNIYLCVEDGNEVPGFFDYPQEGFLPGLVAYAKVNGIQASSIEYFRLPHMYFLKKEVALEKYKNYSSLGDLVINEEYLPLCKQMDNNKNISFKIKQEFKNLGEKLQAVESFDEYCKVTKKIGDIADYKFLCSILDAELDEKNIYVCLGERHAEFLERIFIQLNYTKILDIGDYNHDKVMTQYKDIILQEGIDSAMVKMSPDIELNYALDLQFTLKQCGKNYKTISSTAI